LSKLNRNIREKLVDSNEPAKITDKILIPTYDRRHMPHIREGKISAEIFTKDKKRREELGLPLWLPDEC